MLRTLGLCLLVLAGLGAGASSRLLAAPAAQRGLEFYWIDTEGGAATLIVSPTGESLLFDTGHVLGDSKFNRDNVDAKRIYAAAQKAGLKKIDSVVISHWHTDHVGGVPALAQMMPIDHFYDHGDAVEADDKDGYDAYIAAAGKKRIILKAGDTIPFSGAQVLVVSSENSILSRPVPGGGANPLCADTVQMGQGGAEDQRLIGLLLTFGKFKYLNLADMDWYREMELACPVNKLGTVTVLQGPRHGSMDDAGSPALLGAVKPQVVIVSNGPNKGLGRTDGRVKPIEIPGKVFASYERNSYLRLATLPSVEGIWQEHLSLADKDPKHNTAPDMIANLDAQPTDQGYGIHGSVAPDGTFTITNERNGFSQTYKAR